MEIRDAWYAPRALTDAEIEQLRQGGEPRAIGGVCYLLKWDQEKMTMSFERLDTPPGEDEMQAVRDVVRGSASVSAR